MHAAAGGSSVRGARRHSGDAQIDVGAEDREQRKCDAAGDERNVRRRERR